MAYQDFAGKRRPSSSAYPEKSSGYVTVDDPITGSGKFQIDNLIGSVAPIFDPTVDYTAGQSVMYKGKLYTFKADHPAGTWNAGDVYNVSVDVLIKNLSYEVEPEGTISDFKPATFGTGTSTLVGTVFSIGNNDGTYAGGGFKFENINKAMDKYLLTFNVSASAIVSQAELCVRLDGGNLQRISYVNLSTEIQQIEVNLKPYSSSGAKIISILILKPLTFSATISDISIEYIVDCALNDVIKEVAAVYNKLNFLNSSENFEISNIYPLGFDGSIEESGSSYVVSNSGVNSVYAGAKFIVSTRNLNVSNASISFDYVVNRLVGIDVWIYSDNGNARLGTIANTSGTFSADISSYVDSGIDNFEIRIFQNQQFDLTVSNLVFAYQKLGDISKNTYDIIGLEEKTSFANGEDAEFEYSGLKQINNSVVSVADGVISVSSAETSPNIYSGVDISFKLNFDAFYSKYVEIGFKYKLLSGAAFNVYCKNKDGVVHFLKDYTAANGNLQFDITQFVKHGDDEIKLQIASRYAYSLQVFEPYAKVVSLGKITRLAKDINPKYANKKLLTLGDSISAYNLDSLQCWQRYFMDEISVFKFVNVAVPGATICDKADTPAYDGTTNTVAKNVLGNQVEKLIRGKDETNPNYSRVEDYQDFDIIIIAAGTNDNYDNFGTIETAFVDNGDVVDVNDTDRTTWAGAFRYITSKLSALYPNAQIFISTPIQSAWNDANRTYAITKSKRDELVELCDRVSLPLIDTFKCGILNINETVNENGVDLIDGLHPNKNGAQKIGFFIANELKNKFVRTTE